jgi:hypothetical protein
MAFNKKITAILLTLASGASLLVSCSKSSTADTAAGGSTTLSEYATLLAEDMVLASPTAQRSSSRAGELSVIEKAKVEAFELWRSGVGALSGPDADAPPEEKKDILEVLLADAAPASCSIAITLQNSTRANCYGPSVSWTNHEFDASNGSWPSGDLGIWEDTETGGEACIAAQLNKQMLGVMSLIDMGQFIGAGVACVANKNSIALPTAANTSADLTAAMSGQVTVSGSAMTVTSAVIARDADVGAYPVFVTTINGTAGTRTIQIRIKHIPTAVDDSTNRGKISVNVSNTAPNSTDGVSLEYEKISSTSGKFLLKKINFNTAAQNPFISGSNYTVDYSKPWNNNADYLIGEMNPSNYTGKFSYAWQAGNGDSHTRVFNAILSASGASVAGTGFFGFGPTMQTGAGSIAGMICAWTGPDQTHTPVSKVQRQDITLSSGKFIVSGTPNTVFDPVADCEAAGAMSMTWGTSGTRAVSSTTENLSALGAVSTVFGSLPSAPTTVD